MKAGLSYHAEVGLDTLRCLWCMPTGIVLNIFLSLETFSGDE